MGINGWPEARTLGERVLVGAVVVAVLTFALNYSAGPGAAAGVAVGTGAVIGGAYYLGLRVFSE